MSISIQWPSTLPKMPQKGFTESIRINVQRTSVDLGTPNVRRRSNRPDTLSVSYTLDSAQIVTLENFVKNTLKGVHWFIYTHPRLLKDVAARINVANGGKFYDVTYAAPGYWNVRLDLEIDPDAFNNGLASAPTGVSATITEAGVSVSFTPIDTNNTYQATTYTAIANPGGYTVTGTSSPLLLTGLPVGVTYTIRVRANNIIGAGEYSTITSSISLPDPSIPLYTLTSTQNIADYDNFGNSVAVTDNYVIVGNPGELSNSVQIFNKVTGTLFRVINSPVGQPPYSLSFGAYLVAENDYLAVTGLNATVDNSLVYIYSISTGSLLHTFSHPTIPSSYYFGRAMAISNGILIISDEGSDTQTAHTYNLSTGNLVLSITNPNASGTPTGDGFGRSLAISSSYIAISAPNEGDTNIWSGKVYLFSSITGTLLHTINNPNAYGTSEFDFFGYSIAIHGNNLVIGTYAEDSSGGVNTGIAYLYNANTATLLHTFESQNTYGIIDEEGFGSTVAISADYIVVSAPYESDVNGNYSGKLYVYSSTTYNLLYTLDNPNNFGTSTNDYLGSTKMSLAIKDNYIVVGARDEDSQGFQDTGAVYVFRI